MNEETPTIVVVDVNGENGACSNCNSPIDIQAVEHGCGGVVVGLAIRVSDQHITLSDARRVAAMRPLREFYGTGNVVPTPSGGWRFQLAQAPGDLP